MAGVGTALIFVGAYMMYVAYKAIHTHTAAAPVKSANTALRGG